MKEIIWALFILLVGRQDTIRVNMTSPPFEWVTDSIPNSLLGNFEDDYGIRYAITDKVWTQYPGIKYHIIRWNIQEQFLIAKNDEGNSYNPGMYTKIDLTFFKNMEPYRWGFCLSVFNAQSDSLAEAGFRADKDNPRTGCNGFPFSRMKRIK